jgi:hypothetical protein
MDSYIHKLQQEIINHQTEKEFLLKYKPTGKNLILKRKCYAKIEKIQKYKKNIYMALIKYQKSIIKKNYKVKKVNEFQNKMDIKFILN